MKKVIFGPPGTGKTTQLTHEIESLVGLGFEPEEIVVLSFSKAAAGEIATRVDDKIRARTIHSLAFEIMDCGRDQVVNHDKMKEFARISGFRFTHSTPFLGARAHTGDYYNMMYGRYHATGCKDLELFYYKSDRVGHMSEWKYYVQTYEAWKQSNGYVDFTDMLMLTHDRKLSADVRAVIVDEAQDLSDLQWRLIESWTQNCEVVILAGDDDQAIYEWAGANPIGMLEYADNHSAEVQILQQSFRVPKSVHRVASNIISRVQTRKPKIYEATDMDGRVRSIHDIRQTKIDSNRSTLILYRIDSYRKEIEQYLIDRAVPYELSGAKRSQGYYTSRYADAVRAWYKLGDMVRTKKPILPTNRALKSVSRFASAKMKKHLAMSDDSIFLDENWTNWMAIPLEQRAYLQRVQKHAPRLQGTPNIRMSTIHGAKGWEADHVVMIDSLTDKQHNQMLHTPDPELRVAYVGLTRARHQLDVMAGQSPMGIM